MVQIFLAVIRTVIKSRPMLPSDTLEYIEALEHVAKKVVLLMKVMPTTNEKAKETAQKALNEALEKVDFMNE